MIICIFGVRHREWRALQGSLWHFRDGCPGSLLIFQLMPKSIGSHFPKLWETQWWKNRWEKNVCLIHFRGLPWWSEIKVPVCSAGDLGSIPGLGKSPGEGNGNPLQYSSLENPMDGGASWATVHGIAKSWTRLSDSTFLYYTLLASLVAQMVKSLSAIQETRVWSPGEEDPLEKEMASHSSILAWKIPWTEEPGRSQSNRQQSRTQLSD